MLCLPLQVSLLEVRIHKNENNSVLTCSGVLYQEWRGMTPVDVIGTIAGFGTIIIGSYFSSFKNF